MKTGEMTGTLAHFDSRALVRAAEEMISGMDPATQKFLNELLPGLLVEEELRDLKRERRCGG
jgi:hypothetical protein